MGVRTLALALLVCAGAPAQISVSAEVVAFGTFVQGQTIPSQTVTVTSSVAWRATPGANWLTVSPQSGAPSTTPVTVTLSIAASSLTVRDTVQSTTVTFTSTAAPITLTGTITYKPVLTVSRTSFSYNVLPGQTPPVESFALTANDPNNAGWTITPAVTTPRGGNWLNVSTRAGSGSLDTVIVLIHTTGLGVGSYGGTITVTPGAPGTPAVLTVSLVISSGAPNVSLSSPSFTASGGLYFAGSAPPPQNFTLLNTGGSQFGWSIAVSTESGGAWLLASPKSGTAAATVTVAVNGVGLTSGTYAGTLTVSIPGAVVPSLTVPVTYVISPTTPIIAASGVVHAATFLNSPLSPGQLVTIFGQNLANGAAAATPAGNLYPTTLGATTVSIGGFPCPLIYVSPAQINLQAPFEIQGPTAQVVVKLGEVSSQPAVVSVEAAAPAMFSVDGTGGGTAAILKNSDFTLVTAANPARRGEVLAIYCTGLGQLQGGGVTGMVASEPAPAAAAVIVNFGTTAATVRYAGLAIGFLGLYQVNVVVPATSGGAQGGAVPVTLKAGSATSPALSTFLAAQSR
jgi:uncharacterized protein (TIGR03437 family)